jgi:phosphate starvation-inducible PhoH-like protein
MSETPVGRELTLGPVDNDRLQNFVGPMDENLRQVESRLGIEIRRRGGRLELLGSDTATRAGEQVLNRMFELSSSESLTPERVHLALLEIDLDDRVVVTSAPDEVIIHTQRGGVRGRGRNQREYLANIRTADLTFGIGPAGTSKTYLAVACAVEALQTDRVRRIVLVRPAVEAGERLGFRPGDLAQKGDPELRPWCAAR